MSAIRILDEDRLSLEEAHLSLGTSGKKADFTTIYRAVTKGTLLPNGQRLRLEAIRISGQWVTSAQAIRRYVETLTAGWIDQADGAPLPMPSRQRAKELAEVDTELAGLRI